MHARLCAAVIRTSTAPALITVGLLGATLTGPVSALPRYIVADLGVLSGDSSSKAYSINSKGQVAGVSSVGAGREHAFLYTDHVGMRYLGRLGGITPCLYDVCYGGNASSIGYGINARGQVTGGSNNHAFRHTNGVGMEDLGTLPGGFVSSGSDINARGQVTGYSLTTSTHSHAFRYTDGVGMEDLGTLRGLNTSRGIAINASGQVVGFSYNTVVGQATYYAFRYTDGVGMEYLGTLGGVGSFGLYVGSAAFGINNRGHVVGWSYTPRRVARAFLYTDGVGMKNLRALPGDNSSEGLSINNKRQVVGNSYHSDGGGTHPFLWTKARGMESLNKARGVRGSGWILGSANYINDAGQIVGYGRNPRGQSHAYRLTPVRGR